MQELYGGIGYGIWCQRGECRRCHSKGCECPHHSGETADAEIVSICRSNAVMRGPLAPKCQMGKHHICKQTGCSCKCHVGAELATPPPPIVKADLPLASDENVLELQERIYAAEATFLQHGEKIQGIAEDAVANVVATQSEVKGAIAGFDERLSTMEAAKHIAISSPKVPEPIDVGIQHKMFPKLVRYISYGMTPYLVGPAGSGKTHACQAAAKALDLEFEFLSVNQQTSNTHIMGYNAADGRYIESGFYRRFTKGGVWLGDELDGGLPGIIKTINAPIENGIGYFGNEMFSMHPDFHPVFAANTWGKGADAMYVGANQLDGSTLNRFTKIIWEYDWELAMQVCQNPEVVRYVQKLHEISSDLKLHVIIGMRDAKNLSHLLRNGEDWAEAEHDTIWCSIDRDDRAKIIANLPTEFKELAVAATAGGTAWS